MASYDMTFILVMAIWYFVGQEPALIAYLVLTLLHWMYATWIEGI
jgi:hypothetical protein